MTKSPLARYTIAAMGHGTEAINFFMLNSAEHEIDPAHKVKMLAV